ncbi:hypothetical protein [Mesorhizobium sp. B2-3-12]|uniref:hypothetical protein n=1 Tax=Mesorhizobium sp. B2-3-12 TaxID=2589952 RepID=UPI001127FA6E|nr:hypothetical protein [Mesorhizobium sp. B2-3-12]TPL87124.1 hypothetical protein FJ948_21750 [Mesorhizobium sp. B2-3-12]
MQPSEPLPNQQDQIARDSLQHALALFNRAAEPNLALACGVLALRSLIHAATWHPDLPTVAKDVAPALQAAMRSAAPHIQQMAAGIIPSGHIDYALGCATYLLSASPGDDRANRMDFANMFAAELALLFHQNQIRLRGDPLFIDILDDRWNPTARPVTEWRH